MRTSRPRVVHVVMRVLERSQTFVQRRLSSAAYDSEVLTWEIVADGLEAPCPIHLLYPPESSDFTRHWPRAATLSRHLHLVRLLGKIRPDVVHAHFGPAGARLVLPCAILGIPLVISFYGFDAGGRAEGTRGRIQFRAMRWTGTTLTAEGPALAERLVRLGMPRQQVRLLPLCLPAWALQEPARCIDPWQPQLELLQVARFVEKKGIDITILAVAEARRRGVPVRLTLVGNGELRPRLEKLAAEAQVADAINWTGFRPYEDLPALLANAHAFIQPSRVAADGDTEGGHPTTLIEALAQRVPVISTLHADIPLVVSHGKTGLLSAENDVAGIADAIVTLHQSRERLQEMGAHARGATLRRHDPSQLRSLRERIYREARRGSGATLCSISV